MSIRKLYVEGRLDAEILHALLGGEPPVVQGGSKYALRPRARADREESRIDAGYLRDRDFDYDPPADSTTPAADYSVAGIVCGWRWCRHEIENYLLEPQLVSDAMGFLPSDVEAAICDAANDIREYEAARWTVGVVRRALPPHYKLSTRPDINELALPPDLREKAVRKWALDSIVTHRDRIAQCMDSNAIRESYSGFSKKFDNEFVADCASVLLWFSGKDVLAGMNAWVKSKGMADVGAYRADMRDWIIRNPERTLVSLPEWNSLVDKLRS